MICHDPDISYGAADWPRDADDPDFDPFSDEAWEALHPGCPMCPGYGVPLGTLGAVEWFRCRDCGIDFRRDPGYRSITAEDDLAAIVRAHNAAEREALGITPFDQHL